MAADELNISIRRRLVTPQTLAKPAHRFVVSRVNSEILFEVGHFDLAELAAAISAAASEDLPPTEVTLNVTDRFLLTPDAALDLYAVSRALVMDLKKQGIIDQLPK